MELLGNVSHIVLQPMNGRGSIRWNDWRYLLVPTYDLVLVVMTGTLRVDNGRSLQKGRGKDGGCDG